MCLPGFLTLHNLEAGSTDCVVHASGTPVQLYTPLPSDDDLLFARNKKKLAEVLGRVRLIVPHTFLFCFCVWVIVETCFMAVVIIILTV